MSMVKWMAASLIGGLTAFALAAYAAERAWLIAAQAIKPGDPPMVATQTIVLSSTAFAYGEPIPRKYTADGEDVSPPINWSNLPEGARQVALIVDDPDAPAPKPWVHWVAYNLRPGMEELPEGIGNNVADSIEQIIWGRNSWNTLGYRGPDPPKGPVHHYHFRLYALDTELTLSQGLDKAGLLHAMQGHILGEGEMVGTYQR